MHRRTPPRTASAREDAIATDRVWRGIDKPKRTGPASVTSPQVAVARSAETISLPRCRRVGFSGGVQIVPSHALNRCTRNETFHPRANAQPERKLRGRLPRAATAIVKATCRRIRRTNSAAAHRENLRPLRDRRVGAIRAAPNVNSRRRSRGSSQHRRSALAAETSTRCRIVRHVF